MIRVRKVADHLEVRAPSPREAAEMAKTMGSHEWTGQSDEQLTLKVFAEPHFDTDEPLYQE